MGSIVKMWHEKYNIPKKTIEGLKLEGISEIICSNIPTMHSDTSQLEPAAQGLI